MDTKRLASIVQPAAARFTRIFDHFQFLWTLAHARTPRIISLSFLLIELWALRPAKSLSASAAHQLRYLPAFIHALEIAQDQTDSAITISDYIYISIAQSKIFTLTRL